MSQTIVKRPLTPYFIFLERQKENGIIMNKKEGSEKWKAMTESEKRPYMETYKKGKENFDNYLKETGIYSSKTHNSYKPKPTCYLTSKVRAICGSCENLMPITKELCNGLSRIMVI